MNAPACTSCPFDLDICLIDAHVHTRAAVPLAIVLGRTDPPSFFLSLPRFPLSVRRSCLSPIDWRVCLCLPDTLEHRSSPLDLPIGTVAATPTSLVPPAPPYYLADCESPPRFTLATRETPANCAPIVSMQGRSGRAGINYGQQSVEISGRGVTDVCPWRIWNS